MPNPQRPKVKDLTPTQKERYLVTASIESDVDFDQQNIPLKGLPLDLDDLSGRTKNDLAPVLKSYNSKLVPHAVVVQAELIVIQALIYKIDAGVIKRGKQAPGYWDEEHEWFYQHPVTETGLRIMEKLRAYVRR